MLKVDIVEELEKINHILGLIANGSCTEFSGIDKFPPFNGFSGKSEVDEQTIKSIYANIASVYAKIMELNLYSSALAKGNLNTEFPSRKNYLVGGLKELHANLLHLTWKVNQIARGDYNQKVDFMGDFSAAFNEMVAKLRNRDILLCESRSIIEVLFVHSNILVFVVDSKTGELIYGKGKDCNIYYDSNFSELSSNITEKLKEKSLSTARRMYDWDLFSETDNKWYAVKSMAMTWTTNQEVFFHMLFDISEQKVIQERLEMAVSIDSKTGAYSSSFATDELQSLMNSGNFFCVCYFDLDGLKAVNDTMGHIFGDELLRAFVSIVTKSIRTVDRLCRLGGDEFLLITPMTDENTTLKMISRIEEKVRISNLEGDFVFKISFSYGIEYYDGVSTTTPKAIIDSADKKMYEQKRLKKFKNSINHL